MNALSVGFSFCILSIVASTTSEHEISREAISLERCFIVRLLISSNDLFKKNQTSYYYLESLSGDDDYYSVDCNPVSFSWFLEMLSCYYQKYQSCELFKDFTNKSMS
jgi:hypothetical protein